jgi:hypothetical protein
MPAGYPIRIVKVNGKIVEEVGLPSIQ